jgi:hypothetical protein
LGGGDRLGLERGRRWLWWRERTGSCVGLFRLIP